MTSADTKELLLAAQVLARPDLLPALGLQPHTIHNQTARAVVSVLLTEGPSFAAPGPLIAALQERPESSEYEVLQRIIVQQPEPEEVDLGGLLRLKEAVEAAALDRDFIADVTRQMEYISRGENPQEVAERLKRATARYEAAHIRRDHTAPGIISRLRSAPPKVRWRSGIDDLDRAFPGVGPSGQPDYGMLAQKEVLVLLAQYKVGKTREALNWAGRLLDQGASVTVVALEDDDGSFALKLMAAKFNIPKYVLERYIYGGIAFLGADRALAERCEAAISWFESVQSRLRIYDASANMSIFKFEKALELLAIDKAQHNTTHVIVDYVQAWGGEYKEMSGYAFALRAFAAQHDVSMIEISQMSNDTIRWGSAYGQLAAKGAGEFGQAAHVGIEIMRDPGVGNKEFALALKVARDAPPMTVYVQYEMSTGAVRKYLGTPEFYPLEGDGPAQKRGGRK